MAKRKSGLVLPNSPQALNAALRGSGGMPGGALQLAGSQPEPPRVQAILPARVNTGHRVHPQLGAIVLIMLPDLVPIVLQAEAARKVAHRLLEHADKADALAAGETPTPPPGPTGIPAELLDIPALDGLPGSEAQPTDPPQKPVEKP